MKEDRSFDLDQLYMNNGILIILDGKKFEALNMNISFDEAFWDRSIREERDYLMTRAQEMFSSSEQVLKRKDSKGEVSDESLGSC